MGGVPVGASHAIGRVLGAVFDVPHGVTSCILLPGVLDWNSATDGGRQAEIAMLLGAPWGTSASEAVQELISDLGQARRLGDVGVGSDAFADLAQKSLEMMTYPLTSGNSRPIRTASEVIEILEKVQ